MSKEKASNDIAPRDNKNDIAPSNHPDESVLLEDIGVSTERAKQLNMRRPQSIYLFKHAYYISVSIVVGLRI